jgi:hypothetical protein
MPDNGDLECTKKETVKALVESMTNPKTDEALLNAKMTLPQPKKPTKVSSKWDTEEAQSKPKTTPKTTLKQVKSEPASNVHSIADPFILEILTDLMKEYRAGNILSLAVLKKTKDDVETAWSWDDTTNLYWAVCSLANDLMNPGYEEE